MINWLNIIKQAIPLIIIIFIISIITGILTTKKKKYHKKNKNEEIIKFISLGIILFILAFIFSEKFRILFRIIIIISIIVTILIIGIHKINKNFKIDLIDIKNYNKKEKENYQINNDDENFEIKFETDPDEELNKTIEKIKENLKGKENKYKPKKENKNNFYQKKQEWIKKGKEYEKLVGKYFEKEGYIIKYNGIENGKKDNTIDLIAIKQNEIILIQCKNWKENSKYKITHKDIKAFIGDTHTFIKENPQYKNYNIKRLFVISNKILDKSAINYIKEHQNIIRYKVIKYNNNTIHNSEQSS